MLRFLLILLVALCPALFAAEYKLTNGDVIPGEPSNFTTDGVVFRLNAGGFSPRLPWGRFTQETLKELATHEKGKVFAEPFIEIPAEERAARRVKREIVVRDAPQVERPASKGGFFASLASPVGLAALGVLFLANLLAAFEIAIFRGQSVPIVIAVSAVLPIIGPLIFLALPPPGRAESEEVMHTPVAEGAPDLPKAAAGAAGGLGLAAHQKPAAGGATSAGQTFKRGDTTFNRRFFETQFSNWFRLVPSDAEKDLVLAIRTAKGEVVGKRITRISTNEIHMALRAGGEAQVSFGEIAEVQVRHKDAK